VDKRKRTAKSGRRSSPAVSVCLTFDFDAISVWIGSMGSRSPGNISRGEFGVIGAHRLLDLLAEQDIRSTWFVPGHTIDTYPDAARAIDEGGHEIGHHNYCHENPRTLELAQERVVIERGIECIARLTGSPPAGYRSPAWDLSPNTLGLLQEFGFVYDSSLMANDFSLYRPRIGDEPHTDGPFSFGQPIDLVEIPVDWSLDDWPYFNVNWPAHHVGLRTPDDVFDVWAAEFDYLYHRLGEGVFTLTMHPQVIGRGHRLLMLERLIEYMKGHKGVAFRTLGEVATGWKLEHPFEQAKGAPNA
jgi:peptidoglycan/xylan/chitin deacetylase (PgdA/CDA1 family)